MNVTTKYDIGDKVYIMHNNVLWHTSIIGLEIQSGTRSPSYPLTTSGNRIVYYTATAPGIFIHEKNIFLSKEDVLKHIDETGKSSSVEEMNFYNLGK